MNQVLFQTCPLHAADQTKQFRSPVCSMLQLWPGADQLVLAGQVFLPEGYALRHKMRSDRIRQHEMSQVEGQ